MIPPLKAQVAPRSVGLGQGTRPPAPFTVRRPLLPGHALPKPTAGVGTSRSVMPSTTSAPGAHGLAPGTATTTTTATATGEGRSIVDDPLDPLERRRAFDLGSFTPAPPVAPALAPIEVSRADASHRAAPSLEVLLPALVRKIAWSGDGRRGSVRLELGAGPLAGGVLLVHADGANVSVHLDAPAGADKVEWQARIARALEGRGLQATVEVD
jgi:hypothetical protein